MRNATHAGQGACRCSTCPTSLWPVKSDRTSGLLIPNIGYNRAPRQLHRPRLLPDPRPQLRHDDLRRPLRRRSTTASATSSATARPRTRAAWCGATSSTTRCSTRMRWKVELRSRVARHLPARHARRWSRTGTIRTSSSSAISSAISNAGHAAHLVLAGLPLRQLGTAVAQRPARRPPDLHRPRTASSTQRQLPEIEYRVRPLRLGGSPLYFELQASAHYFTVDRSESYDGSYGRADVFPAALAAVARRPLAVDVAHRRRPRHLVRRQPPNETGSALSRRGADPGLSDRAAPRSSVRRCPASSTRRRPPNGSTSSSRAGRTRISASSTTPSACRCSTRSTSPSQPTWRAWHWSTACCGKPSADDAQGAREILSFELAQAYSFDSEQPLQRERGTRRSLEPGVRAAALGAVGRHQPARPGQLQHPGQRAGLDRPLRHGRLGRSKTLGVTWFTRYDAESGDSLSDQLRALGRSQLPPAAAAAGADQLRSRNQRASAAALSWSSWTAQCWGFRLELREFRSLDRTDRDFRFALTSRTSAPSST